MSAARRGFSLIELLVVLAIIALLCSMFAFMPSQARRDADVQAAAEELAATLREARNLALRTRAMHAVAFNIGNAPGSSGRVLVNHAGGHWYRILGPWPRGSDDTILPWPQYFRDGNLLMQDFLTAMDVCWVGEKHVLPLRKVRFLALSDQDDGGLVQPWATTTGDGRDRYQPTYPRPWCGWWDAASGRLNAWGGYDPELVSPARGRCTTGFWYEGDEGRIVGSRNPRDRDAGSYSLYRSGEPRALVDARLQDYLIIFYPDGSAAEGPVMNAREQSFCRGFQAGPGGQSLADRYERIGNEFDRGSPMTSYHAYTGSWYITLAPDAASDDDHVASAAAAVDSLMPAYRVGVNRHGLVEVVKVRRFAPAGAVFDEAITDWQDPAQTGARYRWSTRTDGDARWGRPVVDFLVPRMLERRQWWLAP
jgi:prepilin-type N-terminal cleavage/methylation domain-containing protein